jgi:hypothetical protein
MPRMSDLRDITVNKILELLDQLPEDDRLMVFGATFRQLATELEGEPRKMAEVLIAVAEMPDEKIIRKRL